VKKPVCPDCVRRAAQQAGHTQAGNTDDPPVP
jgi:hypothetical protein